MNRARIRRIAFSAAILLTLGLWLRVGLRVVTQAAAVSAVTSASAPILLIDPGHGGEDGGAAAADGTLEKDINLSIALPLRDAMRLFGFRVTLTRETDVSIYDANAVGVRGKKVSDMKKRLALYEQADLAVGIHQNHFSQPRYYGTQVFYSTSLPDSRTLAEKIRETVCRELQPDNKRELKAADANIYLLANTTVPAVFVECGFLSNETEREKLKQTAYQRQMALAIAGGILQYQAE